MCASLVSASVNIIERTPRWNRGHSIIQKVCSISAAKRDIDSMSGITIYPVTVSGRSFRLGARLKQLGHKGTTKFSRREWELAVKLERQ